MILSFKDYCIQEEVIIFKDKDRTPAVRDIFTGDILKLKEFLQTYLKDKNLVSIGSGNQGYAFKWKNPKPLTDEFMEKDFLGENNLNKPKVIKITPSEHEASVAMEYIKKFKGKEIPGLATYFWIKEVYLPKDKQWSSVYGPPGKEVFLRYPRAGFTTRIDEPEEEVRQRFTTRTTTDKRMRNFFSQTKKDKIWIICLEELKMLSEKQIAICKFISNYDWIIRDNRELWSKATVTDLWRWLVTDIYNTEFKDIFTIGSKVKSSWKDLFLYHEISAAYLVEWFDKWLTLYEMSETWGFSTDDAHLDNLGMRGDELVVFDCM